MKNQHDAEYIVKHCYDGMYEVLARYPNTEPDCHVAVFLHKTNAEMFANALNYENLGIDLKDVIKKATVEVLREELLK